MFIFFSQCSNQTANLILPFNKENVWYYLVKGYQSAEYNAPKMPEISDSLSLDYFSYKSNVPELDTVKIVIRDITVVNDDSIYYTFNRDLVRFWGKKIIKVKDGYLRDFGAYGGYPYIIKTPITLNKKWRNNFPFVSESCEIITTDTTLTFGKDKFHNCIGVNITQSREGELFLIELYFNEKYGLVYYNDLTGFDEIRLLQMKKQL